MEKELQDFKDKINLKQGFNAYWNKGFDDAVKFLEDNKALSQHDVMRSAFKEAYDKWHETENDGELGNWLFAKSKGITT